MSYLGNAFKAGRSILEGMNVTIKEFFQDPVTLQYPDEQPKLPGWSRAVPLQKTDLTTGAYKCTSCGLCEQACPVDVIHIESHQDPVTKKKFIDVYDLDMSRCMLCNLCIEACPFDALVMGNDFEQAADNTGELVYDFKRLLRLGLAYSKPEEQAVRSNNVGGAVPEWIFAEKTGADLDDMPKGVELGELCCFEVEYQRKQEAAKAAAAAKAAEAAAKAPEAAAPSAKPEVQVTNVEKAANEYKPNLTEASKPHVNPQFPSGEQGQQILNTATRPIPDADDPEKKERPEPLTRPASEAAKNTDGVWPDGTKPGEGEGAQH